MRQCAWCGSLVAGGPQGPAILHTVCLECLPQVRDFPIEDIGALSSEQADRLPFGFIRLDGENRIIGYNAEEHERSRLQPDSVYGKDFFAEIAPCANVKQFAGWVEEHRRRRATATTQFQFVFEFRFGRELVEIGLTYNALKDQVYILVRSAARQDTRGRSAAG